MTTSLRYKILRENYLERIADLQKKYPNVPREVIEDSIGSGNNPNQHFKKLKAAHVNEYADALHAASQRKKRGGKVKKKKKKTRSKPNKVMVGYKAGGKV